MTEPGSGGAEFVGGPDDEVELDHVVEWVDLDAPAVRVDVDARAADTGAARAGAAFAELVEVMDRLRSPGGCPWDAEQTHESLTPYLIEEAYETLEAIETGTPADVREELGDVLLQVVFHARIAQEPREGTGFDAVDVVRGLIEKLRRRHPHVFDNDNTDSAAAAPELLELHARWDAIKREEKPERKGPFDGIPAALPGLALAQKHLSRARRAGLSLPETAAPSEAVTVSEAVTEEQIGDALLGLVRAADEHDVDPERALRLAVGRWRDSVT